MGMCMNASGVSDFSLKKKKKKCMPNKEENLVSHIKVVKTQQQKPSKTNAAKAENFTGFTPSPILLSILLYKFPPHLCVLQCCAHQHWSVITYGEGLCRDHQ